MIKKIYAIICAISLITAFSAFGMDTYPCDNCQEEKSILNQESVWDAGVQCDHILCHECEEIINKSQKSIEDKVWWNCERCSYFLNQKNKQCWKTTNQKGSSGNSGGSHIRATAFKKMYPNRDLLAITNTTAFPQNPNNPLQRRPAHQQHGNPPIPGDFVIDNNIKWIGATGAVALVCYGAYKAYYWWKGEEKKENDDEIDEWEDWKKETKTAE